jgi:hypothetical protein
VDNVNVSLSLSPKLIWALSKLAEEKNLSFNSFCRSSLEQALLREQDEEDKRPGKDQARTGNKRKYPRHGISVPAAINLNGREIGSDELRMVDISLGGALLTLPKGHDLLKNLVSESASFDLTLTLPEEEEPILFTSKTSRIRKDNDVVQIGISFDEYSYYDFIKLYNFLG